MDRGSANLVRKLSLHALTLCGGTATAGWLDRRPVGFDPINECEAACGIHRRTARRRIDTWLDHWAESPDGKGWLPFLPAWPSAERGSWWHPMNMTAASDMMLLKAPSLQVALYVMGPLRAAARFGRPYVTLRLNEVAMRTGRSKITIMRAIDDLCDEGQIEKGPKRSSTTLLSACPLSQITAYSGADKTSPQSDKTSPPGGQNYTASGHNQTAHNIVIGKDNSVSLDAGAGGGEKKMSRFEMELASFLKRG